MAKGNTLFSFFETVHVGQNVCHATVTNTILHVTSEIILINICFINTRN